MLYIAGVFKTSPDKELEMTIRKDQIIELNQNYNDLGEDLLLLEAVILAAQEENGFPRAYVTSSLDRMLECIKQHTEDICILAKLIQEEASTCRESPKQYGRVFQYRPETDDSPDTRDPVRFRTDRLQDERKNKFPRNKASRHAWRLKGFLNRRR